MGNLIDFEFAPADRDDFKNNKCDKIDRALAIGCGAVAGLVDSFFVGKPGESKLGKLSDDYTDKLVMKFAKKMGWSPKEKNKNNVASAIGYLERKFKVNYDAKNTSDVGGKFTMSPSDHHLKSLSHSPDIIGLFFSILDQFLGQASFISDGVITVINTGDEYKLQGNNFVAKLFCGTVNWFGHLMSDVAGSSGTRGHASNGRGAGLSAPFYNLFQLCDFGKIKGKDGSINTIAEFSTKLYRDGYDARFYAAMKVPVILCNLLTKVCWFVKKHFYEKFELKDCVKSIILSSFAPESLRVMLLWGHGTLCVVDVGDAAIRSGGNLEVFFLHINLPAWYKLGRLAFREVCIRMQINSTEMACDVIAEFNQQISQYLDALKTIDIEQWEKDTKEIEEFSNKIETITDDNELTQILIVEIKSLGGNIPWGEDRDFEEALADKNFVLEFK